MQYGDNVRETTNTTGTGTLNLNGAVSGFQTFVASVGTGAYVKYSIRHQAAAEWENGEGIVTDAATDTLSRVRVTSSSNAGALVDFSAGTKDVFIGVTAEAMNGIETQMRLIRNISGSTLSAGKIITFSGYSTSFACPYGTLAIASSTTAYVPQGYVTNSIATGANGWVLTKGPVAVNTTGRTLGSPVFLSATTAGALTFTEPDGYSFRVGWVILPNSANGYVMLELGSSRNYRQILRGATLPTSGSRRGNRFIFNGASVTGLDGATFEYDGSYWKPVNWRNRLRTGLLWEWRSGTDQDTGVAKLQAFEQSTTDGDLDFNGMTAAVGWAKRGVVTMDGNGDQIYRTSFLGVRGGSGEITALAFSALPAAATTSGYLYVNIINDGTAPGTDQIRFYSDAAKTTLVAHADADAASHALTADGGSGVAGTVTCAAVGGDITDIYVVTPWAFFPGDYGAIELVFRMRDDSGTAHWIAGLNAASASLTSASLIFGLYWHRTNNQIIGTVADGTNYYTRTMSEGKLNEWQRVFLVWSRGTTKRMMLIRNTRTGWESSGLSAELTNACPGVPAAMVNAEFGISTDLANYEINADVALMRVYKFSSQAQADQFADFTSAPADGGQWPCQRLLAAQDALIQGV